MLKELIHAKINEVFVEYQEANGIINGDIEPFDAEYLDRLEDQLAQAIESICAYQEKAPSYDEFTPSWYIYTDHEGTAHSVTFGKTTEDQFFTDVSRRICFDDISDEIVQKIYFRGKEVFYAGWQPRMRYEFVEANGNTVWVGYFEHWDH